MSEAIPWATAHAANEEEAAGSELCVAAMVAAASSDGLTPGERAYVAQTLPQLPGLEGRDAEKLIDGALDSLQRLGPSKLVAALAADASYEQRKAAYSLACLAMLADGAATEREVEGLMEVRAGLRISDADAADLEAKVREGAGATDDLEDEGIAWRLADPEIRERALRWAGEHLDPTPLAPYAGAAIEAMLLAAAADGELDEGEADQIHDLAERLPVLGGIDGLELERFVADAAGRIAREGADRRLTALAAWLPDSARSGVFLLAVVVALADRRMTDEERIFLERMRERFELPASEAELLIHQVRDQVYG